MANMSYCRFENTLSDLRDCFSAMYESTSKMSVHEKAARRNLLGLVQEMAREINEMSENTLVNGDPTWVDYSR